MVNALSQLSGESATGAQRVAFQLTDQFLNLMLDPFVNGRGSISGSGLAIGFAPGTAGRSLDAPVRFWSSRLKQNSRPPLGRATFFLGPLLQEVGSYWDASAAGKFCVVLDRRINTAVRVSIPEPCRPVWAIVRSTRRRAMRRWPRLGSKTFGARRSWANPVSWGLHLQQQRTIRDFAVSSYGR